jgi:Tol biopolymer transport system component
MRRRRSSGLTVIAAAALVAATAISTAGANARDAANVRSVATVNGRIVAFDQDGDRLAWIERPRKAGEGHALVVRSESRRRVTRIGAYAPQHFQFGGERAVWSDVSPYGNTRYQYVSSVTAGERRVRTVARLVLNPDGDGESVSDITADGPIAVYGVRERHPIPGADWCFLDDLNCHSWESGGRVIQLRSRSTTIAGAPPPAKLAVGGRRILVVPAVPESCACNAAPAWSSDGGSIAYSTRREGDWDVVISPAGGSATNVTGKWTNEHDPDWSPDGSRIVYASGRKLVVVNRDGTGARQIATGIKPTWSPDGRRIAFVKVGVKGLWLVNPDGSDERPLTETWDVDPAWSPDGSKLAVARFLGIRGWNVTVIDADGTGARILARGHKPTWSADGQRIAYARHNREELRVIGADGTGDRALTINAVRGSPRDFSPEWSPDGTRIAFVRVAGGRSELYTISPQGGPVTRLTTTSLVSRRSPVEIRKAAGALVSRFLPTKNPEQVALSAEVAATLARTKQAARLELFEPRSGRKLGGASLPRNSRSLSVSGRMIVFRIGRRIWALDTATRKRWLLATAAADPVGLSIEGQRVAWAENFKASARVRTLLLP